MQAVQVQLHNLVVECSSGMYLLVRDRHIDIADAVESLLESAKLYLAYPPRFIESEYYYSVVPLSTIHQIHLESDCGDFTISFNPIEILD